MRILLAIVHYWSPEGGAHQSLRPNPGPRVEALKQQLLFLRRLGLYQSYLHMADRSVYPANESIRNEIDIRLITDGKHHILANLPNEYHSCFKEIKTNPENPRSLGFEAQRYLATQIDNNYDLYCYLEDDLLIYDSLFFQKIRWFYKTMGEENIILPQRFELNSTPHRVDKFFIDGPIIEDELRLIIPKKTPVLKCRWGGLDLLFEPPLNPHSGCFFLSLNQIKYWVDQPYWMDRDCSFISPLESAATLGISKAFNLFKPGLKNASWLEIQHFGTSYHGLIDSPDK